MSETPSHFDANAPLDGGDNPPITPSTATAHAVSEPVVSASTLPFGQPQPDASTSIKDRSGIKPFIVPMAAALVVGGILGGAAGAGVAILLNGSNATNSSVSQNAGIVVNDKSAVTAITGVVAKASPSVVTISATGTSTAGTGSGVILSADGYVLTNNHVATLDGASANPTITVEDSVGHIYKATIVGTDPTVDLAVLKLKDASGLTPIEWADSSKLNVGDTTVAMGAPLGLSNTVTSGIVSALHRSIQVASSAVTSGGATDNQQQQSPWNLFNFDFGNGSNTQQAQNYISIPVVQTDAAINPGNSGGALLDIQGRLIGINVAIAGTGNSSSGQSGSIGVGFALPSNLAKRVSDEIIRTGKATHGRLGASVADESAQKGSTQVGALLATVSAGSAADKAGLKKGDIVIEFNGVPITGASDLTAAVRTEPAGGKASLVYVRDGKQKTVEVTLDALTAK